MDQIRVGMIGVGGMGRWHVERLLKLPEVAIVGIADPKDASVQTTKGKFDAVNIALPPVFSEFHEMLESTKPDAVVIATPHTLHFQQAADCLDYGAHVLLEKPMVNRVVDAHALLKKIDQAGKVVGLGYQRHAQADFRYMKQVIESGEFGNVQFVSALQQQGWRKGTTGSWRQQPELSGGGQINDSGSHILDVILWSTGLAPDKVSAFMDNRDSPVDINTSLSVKFTSGAHGSISIVGDAAGWYEDITVWCDKGTFYFRNNSPFEVQGTDGKRTKPATEEMPEGSDIIINFIRTIQGTEIIAAPPICGLRTIELTEAAWESAAAGGALTQVKRSE